VQILNQAERRFNLDIGGSNANNSDSDNQTDASDDEKDIKYRDDDEDFAKQFIHPFAQSSNYQPSSPQSPQIQPGHGPAAAAPKVAANPFDLWSELMGPSATQSAVQPVQSTASAPTSSKPTPMNWDTFDAPPLVSGPNSNSSNHQQVANTFGKYWSPTPTSPPSSPPSFYNPQYQNSNPALPAWSSAPQSPTLSYQPQPQPQHQPMAAPQSPAFNPFTNPAAAPYGSPLYQQGQGQSYPQNPQSNNPFW
jgi:hypothetical protein